MIFQSVDDIFQVNTGLKVLDISMNGLGDSGAAAMGEALKENRTLVELDMRNNRITINGVKPLFEGIVENDALQTIKVHIKKCIHQLKG